MEADQMQPRSGHQGCQALRWPRRTRQVREKLLATGNEAAPSTTPAEFHAWAEKAGEAQLERVRKANVTVE